MKKFIVILLSLSLLISAFTVADIGAFAATSAQTQSESMQRLMDLGILSKGAVDETALNKAVTREELAKILVLVNGKEDSLSLYKSSSLFSDVPVSRWSNAYIQVAVKNGYMSKMPDGKFHPADKVSFQLIATILGRLLKYTDENLTGSYPQNYLTLLDNLDLSEGIKYTANGTVTKGQIALMIYRLFDTKVYDSEDTFAETLPEYRSAVVLDNSVLDAAEDARRIVTDKETLYLKEGLSIPEAGKRYILRLDGSEIQYAALANLKFTEVSVRSISSGTITTNEGEKITVPAGVPFYYQEKESSYDEVSSSIVANSSVIIGYEGNEAVYGALFDPLYSEPRVITSSEAGAPLEIQYANKVVEKDGKYIKPSQIEVNDVVYTVSDIWSKNGYVIVYSDTVSGKITAILPSKVSPKTIEIDGESYTLDESFPIEKLNLSGLNEVGETARIILGSEGTAVDIISSSVSGTGAYALVLNAYTKNSVESSDYGTPYYYVTLLHTDGGKQTYLAESSKMSLRGKLVTYEVTAQGTDYDTVSLKAIDPNTSGSYKIDKDERMIGSSYVANGAVLFNIENTAASEIEASVISFSDLPSGYLTNGQVEYIHKSGDFMDIDVMVLNDALDQNVAYGLVTSIKSTGGMVGQDFSTSETVTMLVNGKTMTYQDKDTGLYVSSIARLRLNGSSIASVEDMVIAEAYSKEIQAVDSSRIRINGQVYTYHKNLAIYKQSGDSSWKELDPSDLTKGTEDGSVTVYLDKPLSFGGKVVMIIVR
jgi:hypothetical protein